MRKFYLTGLFLISLFLACETEKQKVRQKPLESAQAFIILEAEEFRLIDAVVISDVLASGGQAVLVLSNRSFSSIDLNLPAGEYLGRVRMKAFDPEHDEIYLTIGQQTIKLKPEKYGEYVYCPQFIEFSLNYSMNIFIQFATFARGEVPSEIEMLIDRIEIWNKEKIIKNF